VIKVQQAFIPAVCEDAKDKSKIKGLD